MRVLVIAAAVFVAITGIIDWLGQRAVDQSPCYDGEAAAASAVEPTAKLVDLTAVPVVDGLEEPSDMFTLPGQDSLFVVEKPGRIVKVEDGEIVGPPVLDMTRLVADDRSEQGLLSVRPDPDFALNCTVYLFYTDSYWDSQLVSAQVSGIDRPAIDVRSFHQLLEIPQDRPWHQSGTMTFGPEGYLWLAIGDGGGIGDPERNGQDPSTLKGTVVRIDVGRTSYTSASGNPFASSRKGRPEVWGFGLRNPWRLTIDETEGVVYVPDVGQETTEEINIVDIADAGANFGWPITEGTNCYETAACDTSGLTPPVYEYDHEGNGCAVVGGDVYSGSAVPELNGHYFFADYCRGWVRSFEFRGGEVFSETEWPNLQVTRLVTSFGSDVHGELYLMSLDGGLWRIEPVREGG